MKTFSHLQTQSNSQNTSFIYHICDSQINQHIYQHFYKALLFCHLMLLALTLYYHTNIYIDNMLCFVLI